MAKSFRRSQDERKLYQQQIESTDAQIDALLDDLYALTEEEITIVEASSA
jgi:arylsulfatase A-like enzyme